MRRFGSNLLLTAAFAVLATPLYGQAREAIEILEPAAWRNDVTRGIVVRQRKGLRVVGIARSNAGIDRVTLNGAESALTGTGASDEALAMDAPVLAILTTPEDSVQDWLRAGQALERVLLVAAGHGLQAGYLNQPCQVDELRPRLAELVGPGTPQVVIRAGTAASRVRPSPRRPVADVLLDAGRARDRPA